MEPSPSITPRTCPVCLQPIEKKGTHAWFGTNHFQIEPRAPAFCVVCGPPHTSQLYSALHKSRKKRCASSQRSFPAAAPAPPLRQVREMAKGRASRKGSRKGPRNSKAPPQHASRPEAGSTASNNQEEEDQSYTYQEKRMQIK